MDDYAELVATLKAGHRVRIELMPLEPVENAHKLFERLQAEHGVVIGRQPHLVNGVISFIIWSVAHLQPTVPVA